MDQVTIGIVTTIAVFVAIGVAFEMAMRRRKPVSMPVLTDTVPPPEPPLFDVTVLVEGNGFPIATVTHCNGVYDNSQLARLKNTLAAMLEKTERDAPYGREYNLPFHAVCDDEIAIRFVRLSDYLDAQRDGWCKPFAVAEGRMTDEQIAVLRAEIEKLHRGPLV